MSSCGSSIFILTGMPGVGKSTIVKHVCQRLSSTGVKMTGFYTEEVRGSDGKRCGFDVVSLVESSKRGPLARIGFQSQYHVGQYGVDLDELELQCTDIAAAASLKCQSSDVLHQQSSLVPQIVVIDEVGRMELFSSLFITTVESLFQSSNNCTVLCTVAAKGEHRLLKQLRSHPSLITVTAHNRNHLVEELVSKLIRT